MTQAGFPVRPKTLATKATRGGGPPYSLFSGRALYTWRDALAWAEGRLTSPRRHTSEADAHASLQDGQPGADHSGGAASSRKQLPASSYHIAPGLTTGTHTLDPGEGT